MATGAIAAYRAAIAPEMANEKGRPCGPVFLPLKAPETPVSPVGTEKKSLKYHEFPVFDPR
jgi:hypothetical protein